MLRQVVLGVGQIAVSWGIYSLIGWGSGLCETAPSIVYFGVNPQPAE